MSKIEIMNKIITEIKEELKPYKELFTPLGSVYHCCLQKNSLYPIELQTQVKFFNELIEVLIFPHPKIIQENNSISIIKLINDINAYRMTYELQGRFVVFAEADDVAFTSQLPYSYIENCSDYFFYAFRRPIEVFEEVLPIIICLSSGKITYEQGAGLLEQMWG